MPSKLPTALRRQQRSMAGGTLTSVLSTSLVSSRLSSLNTKLRGGAAPCCRPGSCPWPRAFSSPPAAGQPGYCLDVLGSCAQSRAAGQARALHDMTMRCAHEPAAQTTAVAAVRTAGMDVYYAGSGICQDCTMCSHTMTGLSMTHRRGRLLPAAKLLCKRCIQGRAEGGRAGVERLRALRVQRQPRVADAHIGCSIPT